MNKYLLRLLSIVPYLLIDECLPRKYMFINYNNYQPYIIQSEKTISTHNEIKSYMTVCNNCSSVL